MLMDMKGAVDSLGNLPGSEGVKNLGPTWVPNFSPTDATDCNRLKQPKAG